LLLLRLYQKADRLKQIAERLHPAWRSRKVMTKWLST
jgi:hypothetical protein